MCYVKKHILVTDLHCYSSWKKLHVITKNLLFSLLLVRFLKCVFCNKQDEKTKYIQPMCEDWMIHLQSFARVFVQQDPRTKIRLRVNKEGFLCVKVLCRGFMS